MIIYKNNLYPEYYPLEFNISQEMAIEISRVLNGDTLEQPSDDVSKYLDIYNSFVEADGVFYGSFYNYEIDSEERIRTLDYYPAGRETSQSVGSSDYDLFINDDYATYLRDLQHIKYNNYKKNR